MTGSTVMRLLRCRQAQCDQVCEKQTLDFGIAHTSSRFAQLPEANQFREVLVEQPERIPEAFEEAERWFRDQGLFCYQWAPAAGQPVSDLEVFLSGKGFHTQKNDAWVLTEWADSVSQPNIKVVHARALRAAFQATFTRAAAPGTAELGQMRAELAAERLDDPQYDSFVALMNGKPAGRGTLFQVGDIAVMTDLFVPGGFSAAGVEQALLGHLLSMAKRLAVPHICAELGGRDDSWSQILESAGFARDGEIIEFVRSV